MSKAKNNMIKHFNVLIEKLNTHGKGKDDGLARKYEKLCIQIIDILFKTHFYGWNQTNLKENIKKFTQKPIKNKDATFQKRDLIVPIKYHQGLPDFWKFIYTTLNNRYITFEFKNYKKPITQNEIFTTEKYLYLKALRSVAIIFTREGVDPNGEFAIHGAIRENGKFILVLNDNDIIEMLKISRDGGDATDYLFNKIDELLIGLSK